MARENEELTEEARKNTTSKRGERRGLLTTLVGVTCAFVIGSMIFVGTMLLLNSPFERVEDIKVPNLLGLDYESIKDSAEYADFNIVVKESGYNAEYPVGQIYDQSPSEGRTVKSGATIEVKVSQGTELGTIPVVDVYKRQGRSGGLRPLSCPGGSDPVGCGTAGALYCPSPGDGRLSAR